jgi:3-oxoacyl-(acyl-carrier-protein) synthase
LQYILKILIINGVFFKIYFLGGIIISKTNKVVITGCGIKLPNVKNMSDFTKTLLNSERNYDLIEGIGPNGSNIICGVIDEDFTLIEGEKFKYYPRASLMAMSAAIEAVKMSGLTNLKNKRVGVIIGTCTATILEVENSIDLLRNNNYSKMSYFNTIFTNVHSISSAVAGYFSIKGEVFTLSDGCTSSSDALHLGKILIDSDACDICIVGGADAPITDVTISGLAKQKILKLNPIKYNTGVPFSKNNDGFILSEGAGIVILEKESNAVRRNAKIYGYLSNSSVTNDGLPLYNIDINGDGLTKSYENSIKNIYPTYINSQALGLKYNDEMERKIHISHMPSNIPITSIKGMTGHPLGVAGIMQLISSIISMEYNFIPATITDGYGFENLLINFEKKDCFIEDILITTHGLGGNNNCILLSRK